MEILILAMIMGVVVKRGAEDLIHAARGGTPQRYAAASQRRKSGAAGRYWHQLWDDVWDGATAKRIARKSGRTPDRTPKPRGAATQFFAGLAQDGRRAMGRRWEDGWVRLDEKRRTKATRPRPGQVTVPGTVVPNAQDEDGDRPQDETEDRPVPEPHVVPDEDGGTDLRFGEDEDDPTGVSSCSECGGTSITEDGICLSCRDRQEQRNQHHDDQPPPVYNGWDYDQSPATPTTEGTPTMTTTLPTDTEVISLNKAIEYCESTARVATEMIYSIDTSQANLEAGGVTGTALAEFASAKEGFGSVAAAFERAAKEFKDQLAIQEAYNANPGAGSKEFIMSGR